MFRIAAILAVFAALAQQDSTEQERRQYVDKKVGGAIDKGLEALRTLQRPSGRFDWFGQAPHGTTALAIYTFLASGGTLDETASKALDWLLNNPPMWSRRGDYDTYEFSLVAIALSYAIPHLKEGTGTRTRAQQMLQKAADWLVAAQAKGGGWSYSTKNEQHDHSNSQFGILGLRAAANAGIKIKKEVWEREVNHYKTSQLRDGGWGYHACYKDQTGIPRSTSTMTAAGVMGLAMALGSVAERTPESLAADASVKRGLGTMHGYWENGLTRAGQPNYYLLYSIERACMVTGQRMLGPIDWYMEGAYILIRAQAVEGTWGSGQDAVVSQCFALLFLKRAFIPVATVSNAKPDPAKSGQPTASADGKPREME